MTLSQITSHYAGMLKAHSSNPEQAFAWEAFMVLANRVENLDKKVSELETQLSKLERGTANAIASTARIA